MNANLFTRFVHKRCSKSSRNKSKSLRRAQCWKVFVKMHSWILKLLSVTTMLLCCECKLQAVSSDWDLQENAIGIYKIMKIAFSGYSEPVSIISSDATHNFRLNDFKSHLLKIAFNSELLTIRHENGENISKRRNYRKRSVLIVIEKFKNFEEIYSQARTEILNGHCIVFCFENLTFLELEKIFALLWKNQVYNVLTVTNDNQLLRMHTFMPFNQNSCENTSPVFVNVYRNGKFSNETRNLFPPKMKNLHGCSIRVSTSNDSKPFVIVNYFPNGTMTFKGSEITNLEALAESLNFKLNFTGIGGESFLSSDGTLKNGAMKFLFDDLADISAAQWWLSLARLQYFDSTISYYSESAVFSIPPGHELTSVEKLVYPFSVTVWILIVTVFLIGLLVIRSVNKKQEKFRTLFYGEGVQHPVLNLFNAFVGGAQTKLPKNSFARQLLMIFLLYSLVIRTLYLGSFVQLLNLSVRHKEVQSIDEMIEQKFTFYFEEEISQFLNLPDAMKKLSQEASYQKIVEIERRQRTEYFKGATGRSYEKTLYSNKVNPKDQQIRMCKEAFFMNPIVIYTRKNFFLLSALNEKISVFLSAGLIDFWHFREFDYHDTTMEEIHYPQKLTIENLEGSFLMLGLGFGISFFVFVIERLWLRSQE